MGTGMINIACFPAIMSTIVLFLYQPTLDPYWRFEMLDDMIKCEALTESLEHFRAMQNMHLSTIRSAKMISPYPTIMNLLLHFLKFWLQHVWIPSRKTENKHLQ